MCYPLTGSIIVLVGGGRDGDASGCNAVGATFVALDAAGAGGRGTGRDWVGSNQISPVLLVYSRTLGLGTGTLDALFGVYILGLIPGLLATGPISDARGRRPVVLCAAGLSLLATMAIIIGAHDLALLFLGRFAAGVSSGMVFSAGTSWLREVSLPPFGTAAASTAVRRAAMAMTLGFGAGPLTAGLLAQWAPSPSRLAYLPHVALMIVALPALLRVPETVERHDRPSVSFRVPEVRTARFRWVVALLAPWVFAAPAIGFAFLPEILGAARTHDGIALTGAIPAVMAFAGVVIQPLGHRLDTAAHRNRAGVVGLVVLTGGLGLSAAIAHVGDTWLLVPGAVVLGAAYGLCLVAGLIEVQSIAGPGGLARLTAAYYALTYLGFAAPYLLILAAPLASYPTLLGITAALVLATSVLVRARSAVPACPTGTRAAQLR